jgi:HD-like signal output (HDOD) protein
VRNSNVLNIASAEDTGPHSDWAQIVFTSTAPRLPIFPETLLVRDLMSRVDLVDLAEISSFLRNDLGATAHIFQSAACEDDLPGSPPRRLEDCISILGIQRCFEILAGQDVLRFSQAVDATETWLHANQIASRCRQVASETVTSKNPDDAYLVGLFHELGILPALWPRDFDSALARNPAQVALRLAEAWSLPEPVCEYFREQLDPDPFGGWTKIVSLAHELLPSAVPERPMRPSETCAINTLD